MTDQRFGRLCVLNMSRGRGGNTEWRCRCVCGKETWVQRSSLTTGRTRSCGCLNGGLTSSKSKTIGVLTRTKYCRIVEIAKKRKLEFKVSQKYLADLAERQNYRCALTKTLLTFPVSSKGSVGSSSNASLDRIDSAGIPRYTYHPAFRTPSPLRLG